MPSNSGVRRRWRQQRHGTPIRFVHPHPLFPHVCFTLTKSHNHFVKTCFEVTFCSQTTRAGRLPPDCPILECSRSLSCLFTIALKLDPPDGCQLTVKHQDLDFPGCWRGGSDKSFGNLTNLNTVLAKIMVLLILIMIILRDRKSPEVWFSPQLPRWCAILSKESSRLFATSSNNAMDRKIALLTTTGWFF